MVFGCFVQSIGYWYAAPVPGIVVRRKCRRGALANTGSVGTGDVATQRPPAAREPSVQLPRLLCGRRAGLLRPARVRFRTPLQVPLLDPRRAWGGHGVASDVAGRANLEDLRRTVGAPRDRHAVLRLLERRAR